MTDQSSPSPSVLVPRELVEALDRAAQRFGQGGPVAGSESGRWSDIVNAARVLVDAAEREAGEDEATKRKCLCDGGSYEVKAHPFLVHPDCPTHSPGSIRERQPGPVTVPREGECHHGISDYCGFCDEKAPKTPRVARSLSDLQVGQVVAIYNEWDHGVYRVTSIEASDFRAECLHKKDTDDKGRPTLYGFAMGTAKDGPGFIDGLVILQDADPPDAVPADPAETAWEKHQTAHGLFSGHESFRHIKGAFFAGFDAAAAAQEKP